MKRIEALQEIQVGVLFLILGNMGTNKYLQLGAVVVGLIWIVTGTFHRDGWSK